MLDRQTLAGHEHAARAFIDAVGARAPGQPRARRVVVAHLNQRHRTQSKLGCQPNVDEALQPGDQKGIPQRCEGELKPEPYSSSNSPDILATS